MLASRELFLEPRQGFTGLPDLPRDIGNPGWDLYIHLENPFKRVAQRGEGFDILFGPEEVNI